MTEVTGAEQPEPAFKGLYFLRVPRPAPFNEAPLKKLETELSAVYTRLKAIKDKAKVKRVSYSRLALSATNNRFSCRLASQQETMVSAYTGLA